MHGSPPCAITVVRFGVWRAAVAAVALAALAALGAWLARARRSASGAWARSRRGGLRRSPPSRWRRRSWRQPAVRLRWDGLAGPSSAAAGAGRSSRAGWRSRSTCGSFLLLRFVPAGGRGRRPSAGSRSAARGLEHEWHALRCAVYSPQPAARARRGRAAPTLNDERPGRRRPAGRAGQAGRRQGLRDAGRQVPAPDRAADRPHGARRRPGAGHRPGDLHPRLPGAAAVPRRERVLHLAVPDRGQHRQEVADGAQARPAGDRIRPGQPGRGRRNFAASRTN